MARIAPFCNAASRKASNVRRCLPRQGRKVGLDPFEPHFSQNLAGIAIDCQLVASDGSNRGLRYLQPPSPSESPGRIISKRQRPCRRKRFQGPAVDNVAGRSPALDVRQRPNPAFDRLRAGLFLSGAAGQILVAPRMRPGAPSVPTSCRRMAHLRPGWAERTDAGSFSSTLWPFHMPTVSMSRTLWR